MCEQFEAAGVHTLLGTPTNAAAEREAIYANINGVRAFLDFIADYAKQAKQIEEQNRPKPQDIDDPEVHDIYKE